MLILENHCLIKKKRKLRRKETPAKSDVLKHILVIRWYLGHDLPERVEIHGPGEWFFKI